MTSSAPFDLLEQEGVASWFATLGREAGLRDQVILKMWAEGKTGDDIHSAGHLKGRGVSDADLVALIESHAPLDTAQQVITAGADALDVVRWWDAYDIPLTTCALLLSMRCTPADIDTLHSMGVNLGYAARILSAGSIPLESVHAMMKARIGPHEAASALTRGVPAHDVLTWGAAGLNLLAIAAGYALIADESDPKVRETFAVLTSDGLEPIAAIKSARVLSGVRTVHVPAPADGQSHSRSL